MHKRTYLLGTVFVVGTALLIAGLVVGMVPIVLAGTAIMIAGGFGMIVGFR